MSGWLGGVDIGGTKCAVALGAEEDGRLSIVGKASFPTPVSPGEALERLADALAELLVAHGGQLRAVGVSCGGPLDSEAGLVLSPPNLPGWDRVDVLAPFRERFGVPAALQNDANACALAEWKWGAGRGAKNMVFLTFGTGMGAGLILNGRLYAGANDMAGEIGHMRLADDGPTGYGKAGSFEGFCSGGGMAELARSMAAEWLASGRTTAICAGTGESALANVDAKAVAEAARQGDELALRVMRIVGAQLGRGLAVLVDILNPEVVVIGSIYARQQILLEPIALESLRAEALSRPLSVCRILPAELRENVGDAAALSVAMHALEREKPSY